MSSEVIVHPFDPVFDGNSKVLILGSFPSVKSRENEFYYGHERNRFWRVISALYSEHLPETVEQKKSLLLRHNIALWDTAASCTVHASSDSSIRNVAANDIKSLLDKTNIARIYANGKTAAQLYNKLVLPSTAVEIVVLPSTSPANAAFTLEKLIECWQVIAQS
ncbi:MAG: DNA-deoxyinosine glycosylase [Clostridia bacterium]|nr:DNA-deoxyinosine glycosylase [Clostridia bacterium]